MRARLVLPVVATVLAALAVTACGGGGNSGAEDSITEAIEKVATTSNPKNCTEYETQRFTEQNDQAKGKAAVEACEKEAEAGAEKAKAAKVSEISVDGEKATAQVEFEGGSLGSQAIEVAMVEEGGKWKLDQVEGFASYDGKALGEAFQKQFEEEPGKLTPKQAKCISGKIGEASQAEAEELFFSGSAKKVIELAQSCG